MNEYQSIKIAEFLTNLVLSPLMYIYYISLIANAVIKHFSGSVLIGYIWLLIIPLLNAVMVLGTLYFIFRNLNKGK